MYAVRLAAVLALLFVAVACSGDNDTSDGDDELPGDRVTFYGAGPGDQMGAIIAGDFNADGVQDVVVGAAFTDGSNDREDAGALYLFLGPLAPSDSLDTADGAYDARFSGANAGDQLGRALAAGDFDGDGADDLAMAAPAAEGEAGAVYVMLGGAWSAETDFATDEPDALLTGPAGSYSGFIMRADDLDADGRSDLVVAAPLADGPQDGRPDAGAVYVVNGSDLAAGSAIALEETEGVIYGAAAGDKLGEGIATGDVDGDGLPNLILVATFSAGSDGSPGAGETYVIPSPARLPIDLAKGSASLRVLGADEGDQLGHSIGAADTDGDGAADIWLGAVSADGPGNALDLAGEAALVRGDQPAGTVIDVAQGDEDALIYGPEETSRLGRSLTVGDLNGDGLADLAISAPNQDERAGRVFIIHAGSSYPSDASGADVTIGGLGAGDILGHESFGSPALTTADIDGDGRLDLLLVAPQGDGPSDDRPDCGEAYVVWGVSLDG